jgi:hypothetical protein
MLGDSLKYGLSKILKSKERGNRRGGVSFMICTHRQVMGRYQIKRAVCSGCSAKVKGRIYCYKNLVGVPEETRDLEILKLFLRCVGIIT